MTRDQFKKLKKLAVFFKVATNPMLHHCLTPDCEHVFKWNTIYKDKGHVTCPKCSKTSCLSCKVTPYH